MKPYHLSRRTAVLAALVTIPAAPGNAGERTMVELRDGWRFHFNAPVSASRPSFNDSTWVPVTIPHSWNVVDGSKGDGYLRGNGWYRLSFQSHPDSSDRRVYLEFDGANTVATVWLNGVELGTHYGGFSCFRFDATSFLKSGQKNLLAVRVDNTRRLDVPTLDGDFTMFGGLIRGVRLVLAPALSVDLMDHGGPGLYLDPSVSSGKGRVGARVRVSNHSTRSRTARVGVTILDARGNTVAQDASSVEAPPGVTEVHLGLSVKQPRLWNGLKDPTLYRAVANVRGDEGKGDEVSETFGFRTFRVDAQKGFFLNGRPYDLHGVGLHQDREGKGWCEDPAGLDEDFGILKELGATFVRVVHYQSHPSLYDRCDRLGYVAWAEEALVGKLSADRRFRVNCLSQMTELIRQNYNRPSLMCWGIGNEVQVASIPGGADLMRELSALVKREDPGRYSTLATCFDETGGTYNEDLIAHNRYFGWYTGVFKDLGPWMDAQRAKAPKVPLGISEYGAGAGPSIHTTDPKVMDHSEEYQCLFHEAYWSIMAKRPWLWCKAVWVAFDFASDGRAEGEQLGINDKGLVTRDRKILKDSFFYYKAQWNPEPMVYLTARRWTARTEEKTQVKVYTNCPSVELLQNGVSLGKRKAIGGVAVWDKVELEPGANRMEVSGKKDGRKVTDQCTWILNVYPWNRPKKKT